jgi:hypothetical protein
VPPPAVLTDEYVAWTPYELTIEVLAIADDVVLLKYSTPVNPLAAFSVLACLVLLPRPIFTLQAT